MKFQNTNINIRMPKKLKDKFVEVATRNGFNYSFLLREMMKDYIKNNGKGDKYEYLTV